MMNAFDLGRIEEVRGGYAKLRLLDAGQHCNGCSMALLCPKLEVIFLPVPEGSKLNVGDVVETKATIASRHASIFLLLGAPMALLLAGVAAGSLLSLGDLWSAAISAALCGSWYLVLALMKRRLGKLVKFEIYAKA